MFVCSYSLTVSCKKLGFSVPSAMDGLGGGKEFSKQYLTFTSSSLSDAHHRRNARLR